MMGQERRTEDRRQEPSAAGPEGVERRSHVDRRRGGRPRSSEAKRDQVAVRVSEVTLLRLRLYALSNNSEHPSTLIHDIVAAEVNDWWESLSTIERANLLAQLASR